MVLCDRVRIMSVWGDLMRERTITREIMTEIRRMNGYAVKQHGSIYSTAGVPDILACVAGRFVAVEVKSPTAPKAKREPTKAQNHNLQTIAESGGIAMCVTSLNQFKSALKAAL